VVHTVYVKNAF